ncbi:MAG: hypothetical protein JNL13_04105 [Chitinophagaceae bacterium]|nr:hypothetical protein [Chitinophagaceae bacterium]
MRKTIILLACTVCFITSGAQNRASLGAAFATGMKLAPGDNLNWFPVFELGLYTRVDPAQENGLGFTGKLNLVYDPIRYSINSYKGFTIYQYNLGFEGQISFPTRYEHLKILAGIGLEYLFEPGLSYGISSGTSTVTRFDMDLDSNMKVINEYRRKIMPSVSAGIVYQPLRNKRFSTCLVLKRQLLQLFTEDIPMAFYLDQSNAGTVSINYRPTYLKLAVHYDLWQ